MSESPPSSEFPRCSDANDDMLESDENADLERMIEDVENSSVLLTWMTYDLTVMRSSPKLTESLRKMEEACRRCRAFVCGEQEPQTEPSPAPVLNPTDAPATEP